MSIMRPDLARVVGILALLCVCAGLLYVYSNRYMLLTKYAPVLFVTDYTNSSLTAPVEQKHEASTSRDTTTKTTGPKRKTQQTPKMTKRPKKTTKKTTSGMPEYLPDYKNPCWYEGPPSASNLRCIPYFYMAGFGKSGTSTLCNCWNYHPEIGVPKHKEIYFWVSSKYDCTPRNAWYSYLPRKLATIFKKTRIILLMRHPTDRAFSSYHFFCRHPNTCTPEKFDQRARTSVKRFQSCMARSSSVETCARSNINHVSKGVYIGFVKGWLKNFPRSQMLFIKAEDMYNRTVEVMDEAFHFLGMAPADENVKKDIFYCMDNRVYPGMNKVIKGLNGKIPQTEEDVSLMKKAKEKWGKYRDTMLPKTRKLLDDFYAPYNKMLADAVHDERFRFDDVRKK